MNDMVRIIARLDAVTSARVAAAAEARGISDEQYVAEAAKRMVDVDEEYRSFIQEGIDAADRGDVVTQTEMEVWFEQRIAARNKA
jgi:predicted transcriptional regulator